MGMTRAASPSATSSRSHQSLAPRPGGTGWSPIPRFIPAQTRPGREAPAQAFSDGSQGLALLGRNRHWTVSYHGRRFFAEETLQRALACLLVSKR